MFTLAQKVFKKNCEIYAEWQFSMVVSIWVKEKIHRKDQWH